METKVIITRLKGQRVSAVFEDGVCTRISAHDENSPVGNFYVGQVQRIVPQLSCCFVTFRTGENGFYSLLDNKTSYVPDSVHGAIRVPSSTIKGGDRILVQATRQAVSPKEALLSSSFSLSGFYLVLLVGHHEVRFSRRIRKEGRSEALKQKLLALGRADGIKADRTETDGQKIDFGFIVRTNAQGAEEDRILSEAAHLKARMEAIFRSAAAAVPGALLAQGPGEWETVIQGIHCDTSDSNPEVITDDPAILTHLQESELAPHVALRLYEDPSYPLTKLYALETAKRRALSRIVRMKSGANLYIDKTEALIAIDVNAAAGSAAGPLSSERKKLAVNLEAAKETARQLKLRNLSGMILVDFINMKHSADNETLLKSFRAAVADDYVPVQILGFTQLGLVELTRKKEGRDVYDAFAARQTAQTAQ